MLIASLFFYVPALLGFFTPMFYLHTIMGIPTLCADILMAFIVWFNDALNFSDNLYSGPSYFTYFPKGWPDFI